MRRVLAAARAGDEAAFEDLWLQLQPGLARYVRVVAPSAAPETEARVWAEVAAALPRFRGGYPAWRLSVYRTARDCARGTFRTSRPEPLPPGSSLADLATGLLLQALAAMPPLMGESVVLRSAARLLPSEIAAVTGAGEAAVVTALAQGTALASAVLSSPDLQRRVQRGQPLVASPVPVAPSPQVLEPLAAPPTRAELAGWPAAAEAFHAAVPGRSGGHFHSGRYIAVAAAAVVGLSGAAAAAYTGNLPGPLQSVAHDWLHAPAPEAPSSDAPPPGGTRTGAPGAPDSRPPVSGASSRSGRAGSGAPRGGADTSGHGKGHQRAPRSTHPPATAPAGAPAPTSPGRTPAGPHAQSTPPTSHGTPATTSTNTNSARRPSQAHSVHVKATQAQR